MTPPIVPGKNGMSTVLLSHPSGSSADVYLNGAHVTSWIPAGGKEVLFMGKTATLLGETFIGCPLRMANCLEKWSPPFFTFCYQQKPSSI